MKRLCILEAVFLTQLPISGQDELSNIVAIRTAVVVAQQRQLLTLPREFRPQLRPMMPARTLRDIAYIGIFFSTVPVISTMRLGVGWRA